MKPKNAPCNPTRPRIYTRDSFAFARLGYRLIFTPFLIILLLLLSFCDFSFLAGKQSSSSSSGSGGGSGGSTPSLITSYAFLSSNNSALTQNYTATISAPNVYITLPYSVIQAQTALTPTVTITSGYAIAPSGSYVPTDGMTMVLTNLSNQTISNYTLHVSVDPSSIAFLQLANPFYYDTSGNKQTVTSAQYALSLAPLTNTYTLTLNTDNFTLPYVVTAVQNIVTSRPIGFSTANVPYGSFTTNLSAALGGTVAPYTVGVQSPNKSVTNTFTIQAARTKSNVVQLTDVSATIGYLYSYSITEAYSDSTVANFMAALWNYQPSVDSVWGSGVFQFTTEWGNATNWGNSPAPTNANVFEQTGGQWGSGAIVSATSQAQINANNAAIASLLPAPVNGYSTTGSQVIDCGTSFTISSAASPPAISPIVTSLSINLTVSGLLEVFDGIGGEYFCGTTHTISVPITQTKAYTPQTYYQFQSVIVKFPLYDTIVQVAPNSQMVSSWTQTTNSTDNILTFTMVSTTSRLTGVFATLQLSAETGTTQSYTMAIN